MAVFSYLTIRAARPCSASLSFHRTEPRAAELIRIAEKPPIAEISLRSVAVLH